MATSEVPSLAPRDRGGPSPYARHLPIATRLHNTSEHVLRETAVYAAGVGCEWYTYPLLRCGPPRRTGGGVEWINPREWPKPTSPPNNRTAGRGPRVSSAGR